MMQYNRSYNKELKLFIDEALIIIREEREKIRLEEINALKKASEEKKNKKFSIKKSFKNLKEVIINQGRSLIKKVNIKTPKIINNSSTPDIIITNKEVSEPVESLNQNIKNSLPREGILSKKLPDIIFNEPNLNDSVLVISDDSPNNIYVNENTDQINKKRKKELDKKSDYFADKSRKKRVLLSKNDIINNSKSHDLINTNPARNSNHPYIDLIISHLKKKSPFPSIVEENEEDLYAILEAKFKKVQDDFTHNNKDNSNFNVKSNIQSNSETSTNSNTKIKTDLNSISGKNSNGHNSNNKNNSTNTNILTNINTNSNTNTNTVFFNDEEKKGEKIRENKKDKEEIIKNDKNKNIERKKENLNFKGEKLDHNGRVIFDPILSLDNPLCDPAPLVIHNPITISYSERVRIFQEYFDRTSAQ